MTPKDFVEQNPVKYTLRATSTQPVFKTGHQPPTGDMHRGWFRLLFIQNGWGKGEEREVGRQSVAHTKQNAGIHSRPRARVEV